MIDYAECRGHDAIVLTGAFRLAELRGGYPNLPLLLLTSPTSTTIHHELSLSCLFFFSGFPPQFNQSPSLALPKA